MAPSRPSPANPAVPPPIATVAEAARLIGHLAEVMASLLEVLEEETQFVRTGRISEVEALGLISR